MKRVRVYQQIISDENLRLAIKEVNPGHRRNPDHSLNKTVLEVEAHEGLSKKKQHHRRPRIPSALDLTAGAA